MFHTLLCPIGHGSSYEIPLGHIPWLAKESVANIQGTGSLSPTRFEKKTGMLPKEDLDKVKRALAHACNLF